MAPGRFRGDGELAGRRRDDIEGLRRDGGQAGAGRLDGIAVGGLGERQGEKVATPSMTATVLVPPIPMSPGLAARAMADPTGAQPV